MSDFFGDDFTAELKDYFLNQLQAEIAKYLVAIDEETLSIFCQELGEKSKEWGIDARTNEFVHFAEWLEIGIQAVCAKPQLKHTLLVLNQMQEYLKILAAEKKDSLDLAHSFAAIIAQDNVQKYLHFQIEQRDYAVQAQYIVEVMSSQTISRLPQDVNRICGMLAYRGEAIPVFDLAEKKSSDKFLCVICQVDKQIFALRVNAVQTLLNLTESELQSKEAREALFSDPFITHFAICEEKNIMIFDLPKLVAA